MTDIKTSLDKIRQASQQLHEMQSQPMLQSDIDSVYKLLTELSESVESLKQNVNEHENSPIRFK